MPHRAKCEFMNLSNVTVVIPAYNEQQSLPLVLRDLPEVRQVIVANNGSTDRTAQVAAAAGAVVVTEPRKGYGAACLAGLSELRRLIEQGDPAPRIVAFVDADYSDHPDQLSELIAPILAGEADFVLGSRLMGQREPGAMPPQSLYGNRLACWLMRVLFGAQYTDLGPFRAITYPDLCRLKMADTNFGWTVEMQIKASKAGLRTLEVPVRYRKRIGVSKISGTVRGTIQAGSKILYTIAKYGLWQRSTKSTSHVERSAAREV
jgi:glycosyltransferase involved in cell wall biosynthesis